MAEQFPRETSALAPRGPEYSPSQPPRGMTMEGGLRLLESTDTFLYLLVGGSFLLAAIVSLVFGFYSFGSAVASIIHSGFGAAVSSGEAASSVVTFVSDLLLTLIILEVMGTIVHYLRTRATSLKPFLFIGIISATRGILAVGAQLSISGLNHVGVDEFRNLMIELGVNAAVIIALGVTLRLIKPLLDDNSAQIPAGYAKVPAERT